MALRELDVLSQKEPCFPAAVIQREDGGGEVIFVAVTCEDQQRLFRQGGQALPQIVEKEQRRGQLHQKAAVGKKGSAHRDLL